MDNKEEKSGIQLYFHCGNCMTEKPNHKSPREWLSVECGWTKEGIMVWCKRCDMKIVHIDLMGQKVDTI